MRKVKQNVKQFEGIKAIGFDVDGTLYRVPTQMSLDVAREAIKLAANELKVDVDTFAEEYLERREELKSNTLTLKSFGLDGERIYQAVFDTFSLEDYVKRDHKLVLMLSKLVKKYRLFVLSNGSKRQILRKMHVLGIKPEWFDPLIACYDRGWVKPEAAPFLLALETLQLTPPEIVYVGDSLVDVDGAQSAGMHSVYIGGKNEEADASIESVYDIVSVL